MRKIVYRNVDGRQIPFIQYKTKDGKIIEKRDQAIEFIIHQAESLSFIDKDIVTYSIENGDEIEIRPCICGNMTKYFIDKFN